jgi:hypothetical protein
LIETGASAAVGLLLDPQPIRPVVSDANFYLSSNYDFLLTMFQFNKGCSQLRLGDIVESLEKVVEKASSGKIFVA